MADAPTITVSGGSSASITISNDASVSTLVAAADNSFSIDVASPSSESISISSDSVSLAVSSASSTTSTVKELFNTIEVATAIPAFGTIRLRDIADVVGDPTSNQVLVYNQGENNFQFADQSGTGGPGDEALDFAIQVTNTDGAFDTILSSTFEAGTSITSVLDSILNPYQYTTLTIDKFTGSINGSSQSITSGKNVEVGSTIILATIAYTIDKSFEFIQTNSVSLLLDNEARQTNMPRTTQTGLTVNPSYATTNNTPTSDSFKMQLVDVGSGASPSKTITSNTFNFNWRFSTRLCTGSSVVNSNSLATDVYADFSSEVLQSDPGTSSFDLTTTVDNENDSNHTFLLIPSDFGTLKSVTQNQSTDVTADFVLDGTFTATNSNGVGVSYYIYRTNDTGAFNSGVTLTVKLN